VKVERQRWWGHLTRIFWQQPSRYYERELEGRVIWFNNLIIRRQINESGGDDLCVPLVADQNDNSRIK